MHESHETLRILGERHVHNLTEYRVAPVGGNTQYDAMW